MITVLHITKKQKIMRVKKTVPDMQVSLPKKIDEESDIEIESAGYTVSITPIDMNSSSSKKQMRKRMLKAKQ